MTDQPLAPTIETPRLRLRAHATADLDDMAAMWADPAVVRFIGGKPSTREETWGRLCRYRGHWALLGFGFWAVDDSSSGRFIGEIGLADFRRDIAPPLTLDVDGPELGFAFAAAVHGRGYASEAVQAVLAWGDQRFASACAIIDPGNLASRRVVEKHGFVEVGTASYHEGSVHRLRRVAPHR